MDVTNDVLIVDDEKMIRDAVSAYFTKMGCHTYQADTDQFCNPGSHAPRYVR